MTEITIEEFYKNNKVDQDFDHTFYQKIYPETKEFYQPHCSHNNISDRQRLFYHWKNYGEISGYFKSPKGLENFTFNPTVSSRTKVCNKLAVITSFFNPCNYTITKFNYYKFSEHIKNFADLYSIELSFDNNFFIKDKNCIQINGGKENILWQKEALLNIVLDNLPSQYTDVAWVDCDVIFQDKYWIERVYKELNSYKILHLFNFASRLDCCGDDPTFYHSGIETYCNNDRVLIGPFGWAWAGRREVLDEIKFLDNQVLGSADMVMAHSFMNKKIPDYKKDEYIDNETTQKWDKKTRDVVNGSVNYINNEIEHLYHGDIEERKYQTRYADYLDCKFNDKVVKTSKNIWQINDNDLTDTIQNYFQSRNEDKNLINLNEYFDRIYVISVGKYQKEFENKINKLNLNVELFNNDHEQDCLLTHLNIITEAQDRGYNRILIFEDHVKFAENFLVYVQKLNIIKQWKLIYFGGSQYNWSDIKYLEDFYFANKTSGAFAYGIDSSVYHEVIYRHQTNPNLAIDTILQQIQWKYQEQSYVFYPNLCSVNVAENENETSREMKWDLINYE